MELALQIALVLLPVFLIPPLVRFTATRIVLRVARRSMLPREIKGLQAGWQREADVRALEAVETFARERLGGFLVPSYDLLSDGRELLCRIQAIYLPKSTDKLSFTFSAKTAAECALLIFSDLYREFGRHWWFRGLKKVRLIWFRRVFEAGRKYYAVLEVPVLKQLNRTRLMGGLVRLILVPVIGFPFMVWYLIRSSVVTTLYEGSFRYLYAVGLMRIGYYGIHLYGKGNPAIEARIANISRGRILELESAFERKLSPRRWKPKSGVYPEAVLCYRKLLAYYGVADDPKVNGLDRDSAGPGGLWRGTGRLLSRFSRSAMRSFEKQLRPQKPEPDHQRQLVTLIREIPAVYHPGTQNPLLHFRVGDLLDSGYMAAVLALGKIYRVPASHSLLDRISVDFLIKAKAFGDDDGVRNALAGIGKSARYLGLFLRSRRLLKTARGLISPFNLAVSIGGPLLLQQLQDLAGEFAYHRIGRILLYLCESGELKRDDPLDPYLF